MVFLNSIFLWALLAVSIPIIIHIFNFQRPKRVVFTNISFLKEVKETSNARNRLKNILVLLMRILFITCLVMAFAQPIIPSENRDSIAGTKAAGIYLDNSFSMQNEADEKRLLDLAAAYADNIRDVLPNTTLYQLLDNDFTASSQYLVNESKLTDKLSRLRFSPKSRIFSDIHSRQMNALFEKGGSSLVFWISDFQKSTSGNLNALELDSLQRYYLVPMQATNSRNLFIDSAWLENPFVRVGEVNKLNVRVKNFGKEEAEEKVLRLFIDEKQVASKPVTLLSRESKTLQMNFSVTEGGDKACKLSIDDYPLTFDNDYFFSLRVAPKINIAAVVQRRDSEEAVYLENVFSNEDFFELNLYDAASIDYTRLTEADLIVLAGLNAPDESLIGSLRTFRAGGGDLAFFPPSKGDWSAYNRVLGSGFQDVPPLANEELQPLEVPDRSHPFFEGVFENISKNMSVPKARQTLRWSGGRPVLRYRNGNTFMSLLGNDDGKLYLFSAPLQSEFSDFAKHAFFVPTMYKMALGSKMRSGNLAYKLTSGNVRIRTDSVGQEEVFTLKLLGEESAAPVIPSQRLIGNELILELSSDLLRSGNYEVLHKDGRRAGLLSLNVGSRESETEFYDAEELKTIFEKYPNVQVYDAEDADAFRSDFENRNLSKALWRYFLIASLAALLAETVLIRFWKT